MAEQSVSNVQSPGMQKAGPAGVGWRCVVGSGKRLEVGRGRITYDPGSFLKAFRFYFDCKKESLKDFKQGNYPVRGGFQEDRPPLTHPQLLSGYNVSYTATTQKYSPSPYDHCILFSSTASPVSLPHLFTQQMYECILIRMGGLSPWEGGQDAQGLYL